MKEQNLNFKEVLLEIPWVGYETAINTEFTRRRTSCGMCCVAALIKEKHPNTNLDEMIEKGIAENGFTKNGWLHDYFISLLKENGFSEAHREQDMSYSKGIQKIGDRIQSGNPVIVSGRKFFMDQMSFHMILITGVRLSLSGEIVGFYYSDPAGKSDTESGFWYVSIETFKQFWRQTAIFVA